jgi:hypothetical protein
MTIETDTITTSSVIAGLQSRKLTASQLGVHERTIARWEGQGLPVIKVLRLHDPAAVRSWLLGHQKDQRWNEAPTRRGRPRKLAS